MGALSPTAMEDAQMQIAGRLGGCGKLGRQRSVGADATGGTSLRPAGPW